MTCCQNEAWVSSPHWGEGHGEGVTPSPALSLPLTRPRDKPGGRPLHRERGTQLLVAGIVLMGMALAAPAQAGDATAGRQKALQCQACHGLDGQSKLPEAPN